MTGCYMDTPVGNLLILEDGIGICGIHFESAACPKEAVMGTSALLEEAKRQLQEYFEGHRTEFTLPLSLHGTEFQKRVWASLLKIPYGETRSYREIAEMAGCPKGFRAVGMANNRNPVVIAVPCHRVIGANGALVGYGGGLDKKAALLALEKSAGQSRAALPESSRNQ